MQYKIKNMKILNYKPNILVGYSIKDFFNYNLYYSFSVFLLLGIQKLVIYPFIAKQLGADKFGSFVMFMTVINTVIVVIPGSINLTILRVHAQYDENGVHDLIKNGLFLNFITSSIFGLLLINLFPLITVYFKIGPIYKIFLIPLAIYVVIYNIRESLLVLERIHLKFKEIALYNILFALLFFIIIPSYYYLDEEGIAFSYIGIGIIAILFILIISGNKYHGNLNKTYIKIFKKYSPSFALVSLLELALLLITQYILSFYKSSTEVAYFFATTSVVNILFFPFSQVRTILLPFISRKQNLKDFNKKEINTVFIISLSLGVLLFFIGIISGKYIITYLYGTDYYLNSRIMLIIILIGYIFNIFKMYIRNFIVVFFNRSVLLINTIIMLVISITINIVFIPLYGINAAAAGISISLIVSSMLWYFVFIKELKKST